MADVERPPGGDGRPLSGKSLRGAFTDLNTRNTPDDATRQRLDEIARALGGEVIGLGVSFARPGEPASCRTARLRLDPDQPDGFRIMTFAGERERPIRDHVRRRLGLNADLFREAPDAPR